MDSPRLGVLVIDDEPALREVLALRIADWGHDVRTIGDATQAEREIDRQRPDLVLCDLVLPGSSGMELMRRIKQNDERLPVVMITAHGDIDGAVEAMKSGATDFLTKPLDYLSLNALLKSVAGEVQRTQERHALDSRLDRQGATEGMIGQAKVMRTVRETIASVASSDTTALLTGESGTGKEVAAK